MGRPSLAWALMVRRERGGIQIENVPEDCVATARDLGWECLIQDSDLVTPIEPSQSNVRRGRRRREGVMRCDDY